MLGIPTTRIELFFRPDQDCLLALEPDGTFHEFDVKMLREAKELFSRYHEAHFHEEDNLENVNAVLERLNQYLHTENHHSRDGH